MILMLAMTAMLDKGDRDQGMGTRFDRMNLRRRRLALQLSLDAAAAAMAQPAALLSAFEDGRDAVLERNGLSAEVFGQALTDFLEAMERGEPPAGAVPKAASAPPTAAAEEPFIPAFLRQRRE